jgi:hypothetical protein
MLLAIIFPSLLHRHRNVQTAATGLNTNSKSDLKTWTTERPTGKQAHKESQLEEWMNARMNTWVGR